MAINITMPALSPTMEEGNLAKWLVKEGDSVNAGDVIAEIETDKATMEVEAVDEGVIANIVIAAGSEGVKVNAVIAVLAEEGEDVATVKSSPIAEAPSNKVSEAPIEAEKVAPPQVQPAQTTQTPQISGSPTTKISGSNERIFASPLARRIAKDAGLDLSLVSGSGPKGRIVKRDVENVDAAALSNNNSASAQTIAIAPDDAQTMKIFAEGSYDLVPHDNLRKVIARRLVQSKQTVPHFYLTLDCELDRLLDIRSQMNAGAPIIDEKPAYKISVNDMIIKALAMALRDVPDANVSWTEANMVRHKNCDVGVAVSIPGGLITPIVRSAETKSLSHIATEMKDLASRARERKLSPQEYQGGATAVSNLGMFGIKEFAAVINPPQSTILAVGNGEKRPVVHGSKMEIATIMSATLSTDHRAVDGVLGAQLLGAFKAYIENPVTMLA